MNDFNDVFRYRVGSPTSVLGRPPQFYSSDVLRQKGCTFASVYAVDEQTARAIQETAGTAAGFKGVVWSQRLWMDFDSPEGASQARKRLKELNYEFVEYDTGGRGSHFGVTRLANPSHLLPLLDKHWTKTNFPGADLCLYWHLHLIRLPGTIHERTGRPKRLVSREPGNPLVLSNVLPSDEISQREVTQNGSRPSVFSVWQVVSQLTGVGVNGRHRHLVDLALALHNDASVSFDEAMWVTLEVNRGFEEPKGQEEVEKIVRWVYEKE